MESVTNPAPNVVSGQSKTERTIYNATSGEIFTKNFIAGFARAFGGLFIYLIFLGIITYIISSFLLPQLQSMLKSLTPAVPTLPNFKL